MNILRFPSKIDWWLGALLAVLPFAVVASGVGAWAAGGHWVAALAPIVLIAAIYVGLLFPLYYELGPDALIIRFGMMRAQVPYTAIRAVERTRNPLSSPALSLDRLHIDAGSALGPNISPADRDAFLSALAERAPHLRRVGDALVARG